MNYSKQYINGFANKTGFISSNIEKVIRLLDVLDFIFSQSSFKNSLVLKGGTAINLCKFKSIICWYRFRLPSSFRKRKGFRR